MLSDKVIFYDVKTVSGGKMTRDHQSICRADSVLAI